MKKIKNAVAVLLAIMSVFALSACLKDEVNILYEHIGYKTSKDEIPLYSVTIGVIVLNTTTEIEFLASDFSVVRNGAKENGQSLIKGFEYRKENKVEKYFSILGESEKIGNDSGKNLEIVFSGIDNITEIYYKSQKIAVKQ